MKVVDHVDGWTTGASILQRTTPWASRRTPAAYHPLLLIIQSPGSGFRCARSAGRWQTKECVTGGKRLQGRGEILDLHGIKGALPRAAGHHEWSRFAQWSERSIHEVRVAEDDDIEVAGQPALARETIERALEVFRCLPVA
jgi:hypothetical protein